MRASRLPSLIASAALHLALFLCAYLTWPFWSKPIKIADSVPVTIVSTAPSRDIRPAVKAPAQQTAAAPEVAPEPAPPPAPPPPPEPAPAPEPVPEPAPKPEPKPRHAPPPKPAPPPPPKPAAAPKAEPRKPPPPKPDTLNLDQLAAGPRSKPVKAKNASDLDLSALAASPTRPARAPTRGPARPETDFLARLAAGRAVGLSGDAIGALQAKLYRLWHPDCQVEGGAGVQVVVELRLAPDGRLEGRPTLVSQTGAGVSADIIDASARRALLAVEQGEPYTEIPRDGPHDLNLRFNAKQACQR